ncbi:MULTISPECIES: helix-turn-helix domain-containing protein [unclassified Streptococcus]|uniref:helix-turn-helix domain-containing protein n=1 Tax=unclassified Streptococcus TaxID=2608887 RepID=UPI0010722D7F|nr:MULTISPECIES: helix-turn-helix transcriptional regulator [unclassified Streptococcus]MBF0787427.1 helix-turn-helix transcriptional regulator [Streptococcus sp. 19428wC2_LYSM12]MCQ9211748.1 helix-turn-helix transcriptional regulator [Streptococcus sp. B01]MCQ9213063.1 helix-turn-helix transcriptional regulator [Streptococcus sp. O1]TFV05648.1 XRE family transcriptional regulator [Streptococcus sp. LYSM12]
MRWDFGTVLKEIRQGKGLTQRAICGDFLSRTTLSKIENNKEVPNLEKFEHILRQLDMSFAEFDYICHYYTPTERSKIIENFENFSSNVRKGSEFQEMLEKCHHYLERHQDIRVERIAKLYQLCLSICQDGIGDTSRILAQEMWQELEKCNTWYLSDLRKLNAVLICFSPAQMEKIAEKVLLSLEKYRVFRGSISSQFSLLANMGTVFLHEGDVKNCLRVTQKAHELARDSLRVDQLGFTWVRLGICQNDDLMIQKGLVLLRTADLSDMADRLETEVAEYGVSERK